MSGTCSGLNNLVTGAPFYVFGALDPLTGGGTLADNGGPIPTFALLADPSNPTLDAG